MKIILKNGQNVFITSDTHYNHTNICKGVSRWDISRQDTSVRDFNTLHEMNSTIVNNINAVVGEDDVLIHLGDWSFGGIEQIWEFRKRIICKNIYLITGNHDHHIKDNKLLPNVHLDNNDNFIDGPNPNTYGDDRDIYFNVYAKDLFTQVDKLEEFEIVYPQLNKNVRAQRIKFVACHFPICSWEDMGKGWMHLHGHVHLSAKLKIHQGKSMDVGVDGNNYKPYRLEDVFKMMQKQPIAFTTLKTDHHV